MRPGGELLGDDPGARLNRLNQRLNHLFGAISARLPHHSNPRGFLAFQVPEVGGGNKMLPTRRFDATSPMAVAHALVPTACVIRVPKQLLLAHRAANRVLITLRVPSF